MLTINTRTRESRVTSIQPARESVCLITDAIHAGRSRQASPHLRPSPADTFRLIEDSAIRARRCREDSTGADREWQTATIRLSRAVKSAWRTNSRLTIVGQGVGDTGPGDFLDWKRKQPSQRPELWGRQHARRRAGAWPSAPDWSAGMSYGVDALVSPARIELATR